MAWPKVGIQWHSSVRWGNAEWLGWGVSDGCGKMLRRVLLRLGESWGRLGGDGDEPGGLAHLGWRKSWITEGKEVTPPASQ